MPRCARSSTSLVWGIPVHPTHLLRAIKTHQRLLPVMRALRGCHRFAPSPPRVISSTHLSSFDAITPSVPHAAANYDILSHSESVARDEVSGGHIPLVMEYSKTVVEDLAFSAVSPTVKSGKESDSNRKGISSIPMEILNLIETEVILSAHEEDVPRTLVDAIDQSASSNGRQSHPTLPGWRRICVCGERYEETMDVMRCREKVMAEASGRGTQKYLLKHFGLTTAVISTPLKHSIVLLILPSKVSTLPALLNTVPALPVHPPIPRQVLASYPHDISELTGGRLPLSKTHLSRVSSHPPITPPLVTPSDDFIGHIHPGMFAQHHWRLRNQNSGIRASLVDPDYTFLTEGMIRRIRWCVEELVLWKAVRVAREELGYEELTRIEHFNMTLLPGKERVNNSKEKRIVGDHLKEKPLQGQDTEKKANALKVRERKYWSTAIRPSLWLLEELTYEP
ncbi:hypothetical protein DFP73DRAFT_530875 [Morchella snyderi]|nr:hypothetical protein DFP73DRAFT_530875 [Morchella snyderi]